MRKKNITFLICGLIAIAATVIFYLFTYDNIFSVPMQWVSLLFLLIAEAIGVAKSLSASSTIFGQANLLASLFHIAAVLGLSIIFVNILPFQIKPFVLLNILLLCALAAADILLGHFNSHVSASNHKLAESRAVLDACYIKAQGLCVTHNEGPYAKDLESIADLLKFSDNSDLSGDEMTILNKLEELDGLLTANNDAVPEKITEIKNAIKLRSIKIANTKRGSY